MFVAQHVLWDQQHNS